MHQTIYEPAIETTN